MVNFASLHRWLCSHPQTDRPLFSPRAGPPAAGLSPVCRRPIDLVWLCERPHDGEAECCSKSQDFRTDAHIGSHECSQGNWVGTVTASNFEPAVLCGDPDLKEGRLPSPNDLPLSLDAAALQFGFNGVNDERHRHHRWIDPEDVYPFVTACRASKLGLISLRQTVAGPTTAPPEGP